MANTRPTLNLNHFSQPLCGVLIHPSGNAEAEIYKGTGKSLSFARMYNTVLQTQKLGVRSSFLTSIILTGSCLGPPPFMDLLNS
jgi:hypothetical protein